MQMQASHMKGRAMADPDGVRQAGRVFRPGQLHRLVERVPQEILDWQGTARAGRMLGEEENP
jgi:hypothetical protein